MNDRLVDAFAISDGWRARWSMDERVRAALAQVDPNWTVEVVAIGKASREMAPAVRSYFGARCRRTFVVTDAPHSSDLLTSNLWVGEHPVPGPGSVEAGRQLLQFLRTPTEVDCTIFCVSGGGSSLCVNLQPPCELEHVHALWRAAVATGATIGVLNRLRTASSSLAGGLVLREVRTPHSLSLVMVDNVVDGASGVASGLTYDAVLEPHELTDSLEKVALASSPVAERLRQAAHIRSDLLARPPTTRHRNVVVAEPADLLAEAIGDAEKKGYRVLSLGAAVVGDAVDVAREIAGALRESRRANERRCVIGVGEVAVTVRGGGRGGRCQHLAAAMALELSQWEGDVGFVARASDGRDHVADIAGAWVDSETYQRGRDIGLNWKDVVAGCDSYGALSQLDQLVPGGATGWNLCDVYVACV